MNAHWVVGCDRAIQKRPGFIAGVLLPQLIKCLRLLYFYDRFQKPNPFKPDIVVSIDNVMEQKLQALLKLESQFIEGCVSGHEGMIPKSPAEWKAARRRVRERFTRRYEKTANQYRDKLIELYGEEKGKKIKCAEAFELCEYGRRPSQAELIKLFPFFGK